MQGADTTSDDPEKPRRRFIKLPGPSAEEEEQQVAQIIEDACRIYDSRDLGARTRRNESGRGQLRVDFTYETANPTVALEVTTVLNSRSRATSSGLDRLELELEQIATAERLGEWNFAVWSHVDLRPLRPLLVELLKRPDARSGTTLFQSDQTPTGVGPTTQELLSELFKAGLVSAFHVPGADGVSFFPPVADVAAEQGFSDILDQAIQENSQKLGEARPRETHLAVYVERSGLSADPSRTPAPDLVEDVDVLWVSLGYYNAKHTYRLWRTYRGTRSWQLFNHPLGRENTTVP